MADKYCPNCGNELAAGVKYCPECGEGVATSEELLTETVAEPGYAEPRYSHEPAGNTTLAAATHILGLFFWAIGPLIVLFATDDPFVEENARNAILWQVMFAAYMLISFVLVFVVIGIFTAMALVALDLVFCIVAAVKASEGTTWKYPLTP